MLSAHDTKRLALSLFLALAACGGADELAPADPTPAAVAPNAVPCVPDPRIDACEYGLPVQVGDACECWRTYAECSYICGKPPGAWTWTRCYCG